MPVPLGAGVRAERVFETVLRQSRHALVVAVVASALLRLAMLPVTTVDVAHVLRRTLAYAGLGVAAHSSSASPASSTVPSSRRSCSSSRSASAASS